MAAGLTALQQPNVPRMDAEPGHFACISLLLQRITSLSFRDPFCTLTQSAPSLQSLHTLKVDEYVSFIAFRACLPPSGGGGEGTRVALEDIRGTQPTSLIEQVHAMFCCFACAVCRLAKRCLQVQVRGQVIDMNNHEKDRVCIYFRPLSCHNHISQSLVRTGVWKV